MNKKNLIIIVAILLISNAITYFVFATKQVELSEKTGAQELATMNGKTFTADDVYNTWVTDGTQTSTLEVLLKEVDKYMLEKKYGEDASVQTKVDEQVAQTEAYYESQGSTLDEQFEQIPDLTKEQWIASVRTNVMAEMAALDYAESIVTEDEIKAAYDADKPTSKTSHILFKVQQTEGQTLPDAEKAAEDKAKAVLAELNEKVEAGEDVNTVFAELAKTYSEDTVSKDKGGDIGFSNSEDGTYQAAAAELEIGEYSTEVVKTSYGYSIILKTDEQEKPALDADGVKDTYRTQVAQQKLEQFPTYNQYAIMKLREEMSFTIIDTTLKAKYDETVETTKTSVEQYEEANTEE